MDQASERLLDFSHLKTAGLEAGLNLLIYKRFLAGANQLAVFQLNMENP